LERIGAAFMGFPPGAIARALSTGEQGAGSRKKRIASPNDPSAPGYHSIAAGGFQCGARVTGPRIVDIFLRAAKLGEKTRLVMATTPVMVTAMM
jgi:hypothetical protein